MREYTPASRAGSLRAKADDITPARTAGEVRREWQEMAAPSLGQIGSLQQEVACLELQCNVDMQDEISFAVTIHITIDVGVGFRLFVAEFTGGV